MKKSKIAVRVYTKLNKNDSKKYKSFEQQICNRHSRILILDTETTNDEFQNLKFGSFLIIDNGHAEFKGIFYEAENVVEQEERLLKQYSKIEDIPLYTRKEFVEDVFYKEVLQLETLCVGFNLPFDLSRLGIHFGCGRYSHNGWFSTQLSDNKLLPRIRIKHVDSSMSFIEFSKTKINKESYKNFKGHFLDLKTLSVVFSDDKHISLKKAGEFFKCQCIKTEAEEHGKVTSNYIEYNLNDVQATYELYLKIVEHLDMYGIQAPITNIYSSASLGKYALKQLGIQPLSRINTQINDQIKGQLMSAYFGGRCEVKLRKTPIEVSVLDFLSMYPSLTIIMGLWDFIIAKDIKEVNVTNEIVSFLKQLKFEDLRKKDLWKEFNVLVELVPDDDILPIRTNYLDDSLIYNVGINTIKYNDSLYYALPDVIASVLLTDNIPNIKKAIKFVPLEKQSSLNKSNVLGINIDPSKDNLIKLIIEKRQEFKNLRNKYQKDSKEYLYYDGIQRALKILANSVTYGIFIEVNPKNVESNLKVYSKTDFFARQRYEEEGKFFNPLIAVMQVAGARLLLAMVEKYLLDRNSFHIYLDTDACYIPSNFAQEVKDFFKPLNPYNFESDFFKIEKEQLLFYGISSKRYVLYKLESKNINIVDYKLHGLGHLLNPFKNNNKWQKEIWLDILRLHYGFISQLDIIQKYSNMYAISKLTVSTPSIYKRFKKYNQEKPLSKQIKPFNFILIGMGNKRDVKPISAFSKNPQTIVNESFIDYKSGNILKGLEYWKNLADIIFDYINHPESKFENGYSSGDLKRRSLQGEGIVYIGKEAHNIEEQPLNKPDVSSYIDTEKLKNRILNMTPKEARQLDIRHRSTLKRLKDRIREGKKINWNTKIIKIIINQDDRHQKYRK